MIKLNLLSLSVLPLFLSGLTTVEANEFEMRGNIEIQSRIFLENTTNEKQHSSQSSLAAVPEFFWSWNNGDDLFEFVPSARIDQHDKERTHADIRELSWIHVGDNWETRVGVRRDFWGVTEFQHLVDIINQSDSVEDLDNEDKLGQPMVNLSIVNDWGIVDFYLLPYFRERTFAGSEGRPNIPLINADKVLYQSTEQQNHLDWAVRWAHSFDNLELALSWFQGTDRNPILTPSISTIGDAELLPYYQQINQLGIELQANIEAISWKLEAIRNTNDIKNFWALQGGLEYTQYGLFESNIDLGWLVEYGWDERGKKGFVSFQNDLFIGSRLVMNDIESSEILFGINYDLDFDSTSVLIEGSRRIGDNVKVAVDGRFFSSDDSADPLYSIRQDDHIQLTIQYYY